MEYKKNTLIFLTTVIILLTAVAIFNYNVDPAGMFRNDKYEYGVAKLLLKGKNVANLFDYDERLLQKYFIQNINFKPDVIVLGSSRSLLVAPNKTDKRNFFNNSVSSSSLKDIIAIYGLYDYKKIKPQTIVIALDPWLLNGDASQIKSQSIQSSYDYELSKLGISSDKSYTNLNSIRKFQELISMPYFLASWDKIKGQKKLKQLDYYPTDENYLDVQIKRKNGTVGYESEFRNVSLEKANQKAVTYANEEEIYSLGDFKKLCNTKLFEAFISSLIKQKIHVVFFLPPYHPYVYSVISTTPKYRNVLEAEKYFADFANKNHIYIYGSYNPDKLNLSEKDFYDGMHLKESTVEKMNLLQY